MATHTPTQIAGSTIILPCSPCRPSAFEDERYGKGLRVHNVMGPKKGRMARCGTCSTERSY